MDAGLNETRMKMLGEVAEMSLVLARDLQQAALVATDANEKVRLATAFHRIGRGLRQSLALHARFEHDAERSVLEDQARTATAAVERREVRKTRIKAAIERLVWTEYEDPDDPDAEGLIARLDALLDAETRLEGFDHTDPERLIASLAGVLGLARTTVIPRSGATPDSGGPEGAARRSHPSAVPDPEPQLGSPASPCGRAEDDGELDDDPGFDPSG